MPGLLRGVARTAVVAGTATAVSNRVSRRQANKWSAQGEAYVPARANPSAPQQQGDEPEQQYAEPEPQYAPPPAPDDRYDKLRELGELKAQGVLTEEEFAAEKARILGS